jgi:hypothetical protein
MGDHKRFKYKTSACTNCTVFIAGYFKQITKNSQIMSYLEEWSECLIYWGVLQAAAVHM